MIGWIIYSFYKQSNNSHLSHWRLLLLITSMISWLLPILIYLYLPESIRFIRLFQPKHNVINTLQVIESFNQKNLLPTNQYLRHFEKIVNKQSNCKYSNIIQIFLLKEYQITSIMLCLF